MIRVVQDPGYERLKTGLIRSTGLAFYANRDELLAKLIGARLSHLNLRDCSSYGEFLADGENGRSETEVLFSHLTIGESYFFRDAEQFAAIEEIVLPDILERNRTTKEIRIWSAGCANGAEPYSLAILLTHAVADQIAGWRIRIYASDLNRDYLAQAAEGKFRASAFRVTPAEVQKECFSEEGPLWTIHPRYKQLVSFHQINLVQSGFFTEFEPGTQFDLIMCRHVMIYFTAEVRRCLIGQFHRSLGDEGWLVVGGSEHYGEGYEAFRTVNAAGTKLYRKMPLPAPRPEVRVPTLPLVIAALKPLAGPDQDEMDEMEILRQLADRGEWDLASASGQRLLSEQRLNPEIHFYRALIFENLGSVDEMQRSLRRAIYLDRNYALAHYHLGLALKRDGQEQAAVRSFRNVLTVLSGRPDKAIVGGGSGATVTGLKELAKMHLQSQTNHE